MRSQGDIVLELRLACKNEGRIEHKTAQIIRAILAEYKATERESQGRGRPVHKEDMERLAEYDAINRVYSEPMPEVPGGTEAHKALGIDRANILRYRGRPDFKRRVAELEDKEWEWINEGGDHD